MSPSGSTASNFKLWRSKFARSDYRSCDTRQRRTDEITNLQSFPNSHSVESKTHLTLHHCKPDRPVRDKFTSLMSGNQRMRSKTGLEPSKQAIDQLLSRIWLIIEPCWSEGWTLFFFLIPAPVSSAQSRPVSQFLETHQERVSSRFRKESRKTEPVDWLLSSHACVAT